MLAVLGAILTLLFVPFTLGACDFSEAQMMNGLYSADLEKAVQDDTPVPLSNNTWTPFLFTNAGSYGRPRFLLPFTPGFTTIRVDWVDTFCVGDSHDLYFTVGGLTYNSPGTTPIGSPSCVNYTTDPQVALTDPAFSKGAAGFVGFSIPINLTFVTVLSPFSAGRAYVRATYKPPSSP